MHALSCFIVPTKAPGIPPRPWKKNIEQALALNHEAQPGNYLSKSSHALPQVAMAIGQPHTSNYGRQSCKIMLRGGPVVLKHCWHLQSQRQAITDKRARPTGVSPLRLFFLLAGASLSYDDQSGLKLGHPNCQGLPLGSLGETTKTNAASLWHVSFNRLKAQGDNGRL